VPRSRSSTRRTAPATSNLASLISDCYELRCEKGNCEDWELICGELGLGATVPAVLQYLRVLFTPRVVAAARVGGVQGTPAAGLCPRPAREKVFLLISCLI
jgi:hypothetical protein